MDKLKGYRTYLASAALVIVAGLASQGIISHETAEMIGALLAALGLTTARSGASNDAAKALDDAKTHVAQVVPLASAASTAGPGGSPASPLKLLPIIALCMVLPLAGCVSAEQKAGLAQLDQDLADLDAHPDSPSARALVHAARLLADHEAASFGIPTATAR